MAATSRIRSTGRTLSLLPAMLLSAAVPELKSELGQTLESKSDSLFDSLIPDKCASVIVRKVSEATLLVVGSTFAWTGCNIASGRTIQATVATTTTAPVRFRLRRFDGALRTAETRLFILECLAMASAATVDTLAERSE